MLHLGCCCSPRPASAYPCLLIHGVRKTEKEITDKVVIEIFEKEIQEKVSVNDLDRSYRLGKNIPEIKLGLLSLNLPGTTSVMQFLERKKS